MLAKERHGNTKRLIEKKNISIQVTETRYK